MLGKLISGKWIAEAVSTDQKPDNPEEHTRIINAGGIVRPINLMGRSAGPHRVWLPDGSGPGLAMSRSFGDTIAASIGVHSEPEFTTKKLTKEDRFLVLGSDGLFEYLTN